MLLLNRCLQAKTWLRPLQVLRDEGVRGFCLKALAATVYRQIYLLECDLHQPIAKVEPAIPVVIGPLDPTAIDDCLELCPHVSRETLEERFAAGHVCFGGRWQGRLVYTNWFAPRGAWLNWVRQQIECEPGEAYTYDAFTHPEFRGKQIAPAGSAHLLHYAKAAGYHRVIRATLTWNRPALRAHAKAGYHPYALIGCVRVGPWQKRFVRPLRETRN
jgi:GNAT superfamily N-acetyltransferase